VAQLRVGLFPDVPLWCNDCADVHRFKPREIERIVWALHGAACDFDSELVDEYDTCWLEVLGWSHDSEMFREHDDAHVEARVNATVDCRDHDDEPGPHHHPECHYYDEEAD
jgi:hypothetical protein